MESDAVMNHPELEFFNSISAELELELTIPPEPIANLMNLVASPEARLKDLRLVPTLFNEETNEFRPLTAEELQSTAFEGPEITLLGESQIPITHRAPDGTRFTVQELLQAITETERQTREQTEWFGGIDVQHVHFEGLEEQPDSQWLICWGS